MREYYRSIKPRGKKLKQTPVEGREEAPFYASTASCKWATELFMGHLATQYNGRTTWSINYLLNLSPDQLRIEHPRQLTTWGVESKYPAPFFHPYQRGEDKPLIRVPFTKTVSTQMKCVRLLTNEFSGEYHLINELII